MNLSSVFPYPKAALAPPAVTLAPTKVDRWLCLCLVAVMAPLGKPWQRPCSAAAAAAAKAALLEQAATRLGAKKEDLKVTDGVVAGGSKRVTYADLIGGRRFSITLDPKK